LELPQSWLLICLGLLDKRDELALASTCRDVFVAVMLALPQCQLEMMVRWLSVSGHAEVRGMQHTCMPRMATLNAVQQAKRRHPSISS
jgi:hypothetical protein